MPVRVRRKCHVTDRLPAVLLLAGALFLAGCGGGESNRGTMPVPEEGGGGTTTSSPTPTTRPTSGTTTAPTRARPTTEPRSPRKAQVIVVAANFSANPAVQGLVKSYPLYFQALVARDETIIRKNFPAFFYADTSLGIQEAKRNGWTMRPPGSVVVMGVRSQPFGVIRVQTCRSQTTQYWNPRTKAWTLVTPKGWPQAIDMVRTGMGWLPYRFGPSNGINCSRVRYPA